MRYPFPADVEQIVESKMSTGRYTTEDELLKDALGALAAEDIEVAAIQAAIDQWREGDAGRAIEIAFDEVRRRVMPGSQ